LWYNVNKMAGLGKEMSNTLQFALELLLGQLLLGRSAWCLGEAGVRIV
jgi:hypothetical protein